MQLDYVINEPDNRRVIIFFTGWSTDYHLIENLNFPEGYDLICCSDYRDVTWCSLKKQYDEMVIIAWSFGIPVTEYLFPEIASTANVTGLYAINGSRYPVDDNLGINELIFENTRKNLNKRNLIKFQIRIAGGIEKYNKLENKFNTKLTIDELKQELDTVYNLSSLEKTSNIYWDYCFIAENDKIFNCENLKRAWSDTPFSVLERAEHLPDFQNLFNLIIKNKEIIGRNFKKKLSTYEDAAQVQKETAHKMIELLKKTEKKYKSVFELGGGSGYLSKLIISELQPLALTMMDISEIKPIEGMNFLQGDAEVMLKDISSTSYDLIISGSTLQWFHSPTRVMIELNRILKKGGLCAISTFLTGTMGELSDLTDSSLIYLSSDQLRLIANRAGFEIIYEESEKQVLCFKTSKDVFKHIKDTGVNSLSGKKKGVAEMKKILNNYPKEQGCCTLTYEPIIMLLKKNEKDNFC